MRLYEPKPLNGGLSQTKGVVMKLWYDDKKIPLWIEVLAVVVSGVFVGLAFGLMLLGYNLAFLLY